MGRHRGYPLSHIRVIVVSMGYKCSRLKSHPACLLTIDNNPGLIAPIEEVEQEGHRPHQIVLVAGLALYGIIVVWGRLTGGITRTFQVNIFNITEINFMNNEVIIGFVIFIISVILAIYLENRGK